MDLRRYDFICNLMIESEDTIMNELLRKIFDTIICYERQSVEAGQNIEKEIEILIQPYQGRLTDDTQEELKNLLYGISSAAEREGFLLGIKYILKTLVALLSD